MSMSIVVNPRFRLGFGLGLVASLSLLPMLPLVLATAGSGSKAFGRRDTNGMDMSMDGAMSLASGMMKPYFHFTIADPSQGTMGDVLWFEGWVPQGAGPMFGTCVGLFLLALVERWIAVIRFGWEGFWAKRDRVESTNARNAAATASSSGGINVWKTITMRKGYVPSFLLQRDLVRGMLHVAQVALGAAFMLVVMTYQIGFIFSIVIGQGVGECLFGRYMKPLIA